LATERIPGIDRPYGIGPFLQPHFTNQGAIFMQGVTDQLIVTKENGVGTIQLNNPERRNAMTFDMWQGLPIVLEDFMDDSDVRVIVISGAGGKAFCAGADISQFEKNRSSEDSVAIYNASVEKASNALATSAKPTIAKIEGFCVGGGLGIALCCDIRIANDLSSYAVPAAKLGLGYRADGLKRLVDVVGPSVAKEIFYTARQFTSQEALAMGLINRLMPKSMLNAYIDDYTSMIAANAPMTIFAAKTVIDELIKPDSDQDMGLCDRVVDACFTSEDYKEGRKAFMEKRKPDFQGK
jgi:enoyl-CoA hydratase